MRFDIIGTTITIRFRAAGWGCASELKID